MIPVQGHQQVLELLHESHPGVEKMKQLARSYVWWPSIDTDIMAKVQECYKCEVSQRAPKEAPLHPWEFTCKPWERLHIDYAGPLEGKMIFIVIDSHSKWIEAEVVRTATSSVTISKLMHIFATHGLPKTIVSDNAAYFTSAEFKTFVKENGIQHITVSPYHPASNGMAERAVQIIKTGLRKMDGGDMKNKLIRFLSKYRIIPQKTTGQTPSELLLQRMPRTHFDLLLPSVTDKVKVAQSKQKSLHDRGAQLRTLHAGDTVFVTNFGQGVKQLPGVISSQLGPLTYEVRLEDGRMVRRHVDHIRLRRCAVDAPPVEEDDFLVDPVIIDRHQPLVEPAEAMEASVAPTTTSEVSAPGSQPGGPDIVASSPQPVLRRSTRVSKKPQRYGHE